jgi:hypothetical protein
MSVAQRAFPDKSRPSNRQQLERVKIVLERAAAEIGRILRQSSPTSRDSVPPPPSGPTFSRSSNPRPPASPRARRPRSSPRWQRETSTAPRVRDFHGVGCGCGMCPGSAQ